MPLSSGAGSIAEHVPSDAQVSPATCPDTRLLSQSAGTPPRALPDVCVVAPQSTTSQQSPSPDRSIATGTQASADTRHVQSTQASKRVRFKVPAAPGTQGSGASASVRTGAHVSSGTAATAHGATPLAGAPCRTSHLPVTTASAPGKAANPVKSWGIPPPQYIQPQLPAAPAATNPSWASVSSLHSEIFGELMKTGRHACAPAPPLAPPTFQGTRTAPVHGTWDGIFRASYMRPRPALAPSLPASTAPAVNALARCSASVPDSPCPLAHQMSVPNPNFVPKAVHDLPQRVDVAPQARWGAQEEWGAATTPVKRSRPAPEAGGSQQHEECNGAHTKTSKAAGVPAASSRHPFGSPLTAPCD